jgi:hypothetical protein
MSDVLPDNCRWGVTHEPAHCRGATSKSGCTAVRPLPSHSIPQTC